MSNALRSIRRKVAMEKSYAETKTTKDFKKNWKEDNDKKYLLAEATEDHEAIIHKPTNTNRKKQRHMDSCKEWVNMFKFYSALRKAEENSKAKEVNLENDKGDKVVN